MGNRKEGVLSHAEETTSLYALAHSPDPIRRKWHFRWKVERKEQTTLSGSKPWKEVCREEQGAFPRKRNGKEGQKRRDHGQGRKAHKERTREDLIDRRLCLSQFAQA